MVWVSKCKYSSRHCGNCSKEIPHKVCCLLRIFKSAWTLRSWVFLSWQMEKYWDRRGPESLISHKISHRNSFLCDVSAVLPKGSESPEMILLLLLLLLLYGVIHGRCRLAENENGLVRSVKLIWVKYIWAETLAPAPLPGLGYLSWKCQVQRQASSDEKLTERR